jgi:hypothetical protein
VTGSKLKALRPNLPENSGIGATPCAPASSAAAASAMVAAPSNAAAKRKVRRRNSRSYRCLLFEVKLALLRASLEGVPTQRALGAGRIQFNHWNTVDELVPGAERVIYLAEPNARLRMSEVARS